METQTLRDLMVEHLQDLYSAETQIIKALPKMEKAAHNTELKDGFRMHLAQTQEQAQRLEQIAKALGFSPNGKKCKGMEGLLAEGEEIMKEDGNLDVLDAGLIAAAQKVEHYEISAYGTAIAMAKQLGEKDYLSLLKQSLTEEEMTDKKLSQVAESTINVKAASHQTSCET